MRRHTRSVKPRAIPTIELFEERIPVAESVGLALAMRALADATAVRAGSTSAAPRIVSWEKPALEHAEPVQRGLARTGGLSDVAHVALINHVEGPAYEPTLRGTDVDALFATLDDGAQAPRAKPAPATPVAPASAEGWSVQPSTGGAGLGGHESDSASTFHVATQMQESPEAFVAAPVQDQELRQALNTAVAMPGPRAPAGAHSNPARPVVVPSPATPAGGGANPDIPFTMTGPGADGIVPIHYCGGCDASAAASLPGGGFLGDPGFSKPLPDGNSIDPGFGIPRVPADPMAILRPQGIDSGGTDRLTERGDLIRFFGQAWGNAEGMTSPSGVRYLDGVVSIQVTALPSDADGFGWGQTSDWTNQANWADGLTGAGMVSTLMPHLNGSINGAGNTVYTAVTNGFNGRWFDDDGTGHYTDRFFISDSFVANTANHEFVLTDTMGDQLRFNDFSVAPAAEQGSFKSYTDPYGNVTSVVSYTSGGLPQEVQRSSTVNGTTVVESYLYSYTTVGSSTLMSSAVLRRGLSTTGPWTTVRQAVYTYYGTGDSNGSQGDLKTVQVQTAGGTTLDTTYYRYYTTTSSIGYVHGLKYLLRPDSYDRANGAGVNPLTATDTALAPYADDYFEYDSSKRVTKHTMAGEGGTTGGGNGLGTYTYSYTKNANTPSGYNFWQMKTIETLPDGNQNIVYTNHYGEVMLAVYKDVASGNQWEHFTEYDSSGRAILIAQPSAVTGYDDTKNDLLNSVSGNYQYLSDSSGLITVLDYLTTTPVGFLQDVKIEQGELGTKITQEAWTYATRTASIGTFYKIANDTVYRDTAGTQAESMRSVNPPSQVW